MKIKFCLCDFWPGFDVFNNRFTNFIMKKFDAVYDDVNPDYLLYSCFGVKHLFYKNCIKIFYTGEAVTPNFNECDYAIAFDRISFGNRYLRKQIGVTKDKYFSEAQLLNRKFCNFIYSNSSSGEGAYLRVQFCKKLMKYKKIDCPGKVLNNMSNAISSRYSQNWGSTKINFIKNYKFTIAFENTQKSGYVTEKLAHPLQVNSIPIYWGDPDVGVDFNEKSFINCNNFKTFDEVIEVVKYLDGNDNAYLNMIREPAMNKFYRSDDDNELEYIKFIIENYNKPINKDDHNLCKGNFQLVAMSYELVKLYLESNNLNRVEMYCCLALSIDSTRKWPYEILEELYIKHNNETFIKKILEYCNAYVKQDIKNHNTDELLKYCCEKLCKYNYFIELENVCRLLIEREIEISWPYYFMSKIYYNKLLYDTAYIYIKLALQQNNNKMYYEFKDEIESKIKYSI